MTAFLVIMFIALDIHMTQVLNYNYKQLKSKQDKEQDKARTQIFNCTHLASMATI